MTNPVSSDLANHTPITNQTEQGTFAGKTWFSILKGDPSLPKEQRNLVRTINLFGLSLCLIGSVLLGITIPLSDDSISNSELMYSKYRDISSLRFPCLILGASALYFAKLTTTYLKKTNENQTEISPKLMHEIEEQVKKSMLSLQKSKSIQ
ncbi:hypothetical protein [Candidatus Rhabdochlamydia porcellionis]|jgi:hypothetical protein|uniref:Transmembrane protein 242 n=1 Tax=Candidatus Rhabdochlamydia porcellionis TaxID=225148 RepID=A0ABX8Z182_9BACT|nr:hypothetical protein [Candidatus Rhabdochlamydia porcellionis]QZA59431.1 hypothetical protein RHAB15C_0001319 [Candidatus Rhabdochlamydia porcellionis]